MWDGIGSVWNQVCILHIHFCYTCVCLRTEKSDSRCHRGWNEAIDLLCAKTLPFCRHTTLCEFRVLRRISPVFGDIWHLIVKKVRKEDSVLLYNFCYP